jgi:hypothetical protein
MIKKIEIDTNFHSLSLTCNQPTITKSEIEKRDLIAGELIIAYQDNDEWNGIVCFDESLPEHYQWYIELDLPSYRQIN